MNLDSLSLTLSQISHIVTNLTKKNYKSSQIEISSLIEKQGFEAERHLYRCLFSSIDFTADNNKTTVKDYHQTQYLKECFVSLLTKPHFISTINFSIDNPLQFQEQSKSSNNILTNISKTLKLNKIQEIVLAIALQQSNKEEIKKRSQEYLKQKLLDLVNSPFSEIKDLNFSEVPIEIFQLILIEIETQLKPNSNLTEFYNKLKKDFPKDKTSLLLAPYIYPEEFDQSQTPFNDLLNSNNKSIMDHGVAETIQEFGYGFTSNHDECRRILLYLSSSAKDLLTPLNVAKILSMMARTHNNLNIDHQILINPNSLELMNEAIGSGLTWNVDVFVAVVNELMPNLAWKEVVKEFENSDLFLKDKVGLRIIIQALKKGLKEAFPIEYIYRIWKRGNESQLSWIIQSLKHPDIFCIADYPCRKTVTECLKVQPEEDNKVVSSWRSLNLIETLLTISDNGFYAQCIDIFKTPVTHCPDLLLLGLLQLNNIMNKLKQDLIATLIPIFLGNHPNSAVILQYAWSQNLHPNIIRNIIMSSMTDWYMKASEMDQNSRLARILDVSQDLKALFVLLNGHPMIFNIDLACLAARRGYLKLDKWMSDRIRDHGELFIATVISFLRKRVPQLSGKDDQFNMARSVPTPLLPETLQTILKCISSAQISISTELQQEIYQINLEARALIEKSGISQKMPTQTPQNIGSQNFELLQSMMSNMNMNMNNNTNSNFNSPSKIFTPPIGVNQNPLQAVNLNAQASLGGYGNQNMLLHNPNTIDANKALNNLLTNNNQQINRFNAYGTNLMRPGSSSIQAENVDQNFQNFSIEEEVEKCIMRLFKTSSLNAPSNPYDRLGVEEFADILAKFKDSHEKKEKEFYTHALKYLIDGNTSLYSLDETQFTTMVNLWGVLIQKGVLSNYFQANCLKLLFQMLYKPPVSRDFKFAVMVLERCKNRIKDYSDFCLHVSQGPNYSEVPKSLKEFIEYGRNINQMNPMTPIRSLTPPNNMGGYSSTSAQQQLQRNLSNQPNQLNNAQLAKPHQMLTSPQPNMMTNPQNSTQSMASHSRSVSGKPSIANATNIDTLLVANENDITSKPVPPSESVQDKISFIFNNLSLSNMQAKGDELKDTVKEEFWDWIAHYLVVKRVSIEPNFHVLYSQFIDTLKKDILNLGVLSETFRNIKVLLRSDKNDQKFCDRALLKNLGSWLGLITLAKNKPVLHKDIDLKCLIVEAFQKGQSELLFVVPFVAKVLEPACKSRIFQPPNPWLMAILSVLVELHNEPDLKLNHKFEIEVLCKNLSIQITDIGVKNILRNHEISEEQLTKRKEPGSASSIQAISSGVNSSNNAILSGPQPNMQTQISTPPQSTNVNNNLQGNVPQVSSQIQQQQQQQDVQQVSIEGNANILQIQNNNVYPPTLTPAPKFKLTDIKTQNIQSNQSIIYINPAIQMFVNHPVLKSLVIPGLEKATMEIQSILLEKAVKISISAAELLIKKDFALESDEAKILKAARSMIANMSSGMMLITAKEPLTTHLKATLTKALTNSLDVTLVNAFKDLINEAVTILVDDNIEVCMCFLQKCAIQKSIIELEKRLTPELELRQRSHSENRPYYDANVLNYQNEKMPEMIRLKVNSVGSQFSVYEEFSKNIPGFKAHEEKPSYLPNSTQPNASQPNPTQPNLSQSVDEINSLYDAMIISLENDIATLPPNQSLTASLQSILATIQEFKMTNSVSSANSLVKKLVYNILETCASYNDNSGATNEIVSKCRDKNFQVVKLILSDPRFTNGGYVVKEVQKVWIECQNEAKYSVESVAILFKLKLLNFQTVDSHIAQYVEAGNPKAIHFATQLIKFFYIEHASMFSDIQFENIMESVTKTSSNPRIIYQNSELRDIMEVIRMNYDITFTDRVCATALSMMYTGVTQARDFDDPHGLKEKSELLLQEWIQHHAPVPNKENTKAFQQFVLQMNSQGLFKTDDMITRFFRICTELCVASCNSILNISKAQRASCYSSLDAFVKLIILLVKHSGDQTNHINKINLFNKVLGLIGGCLLYDHEIKGTQFEPMPFHRLLHMLLYEATLPENNLEAIMPNVLQAFVNVYHIIRPSKAPGFAFSWLELVSHRIFLPKMLNVYQPSPDQNYKSWTMYAILLTQLIRFLAPFLRNIQLNEPIQFLYKGTLRLFLVLLHDFPEFLCSCHYQFCDTIPSNCIQLRNLILSAFPRTMKLPDPLTPNLKVDMIGEVDPNPPKITFPYVNNIPLKLKNDLDIYIKTRSPVTFLSDLRSYLQTSPDPGCHYNIQLMNALVMYVGAQGITALRAKSLIPSLATLTHASHSAHSDIFQSLVADLDSEGRYLFINAVANQLRYPNSHTHYFGCALLNLFSEANSEAIQEQITRVLLERLIVNRPHPWGLLVTFIELIRNPLFKFWNHQFVHCAPEIEKMFVSLGRNVKV